MLLDGRCVSLEAMRRAIFSGLFCLGVVGALVLWLNDTSGRVTRGSALEIPIGVSSAVATTVLRNRYGNVSYERLSSCFGEASTRDLLISLAKSWPYAIVCVEVQDRRVKSVSWKRNPLGR